MNKKIPSDVPIESIPMEINTWPAVPAQQGESFNTEVVEADEVNMAGIDDENEDVQEDQSVSSTGEKTANGQTLEDIKHRRAATYDQMKLLISKVEEEFDNEIIRVQEETERAVYEIQKYGKGVVAHVQMKRTEFISLVKSGMIEFKELNDKAVSNIDSLDFIQNQFSNTFRETGLLG